MKEQQGCIDAINAAGAVLGITTHYPLQDMCPCGAQHGGRRYSCQAALKAAEASAAAQMRCSLGANRPTALANDTNAAAEITALTTRAKEMGFRAYCINFRTKGFCHHGDCRFAHTRPGRSSPGPPQAPLPPAPPLDTLPPLPTITPLRHRLHTPAQPGVGRGPAVEAPTGAGVAADKHAHAPHHSRCTAPQGGGRAHQVRARARRS